MAAPTTRFPLNIPANSTTPSKPQAATYTTPSILLSLTTPGTKLSPNPTWCPRPSEEKRFPHPPLYALAPPPVSPLKEPQFEPAHRHKATHCVIPGAAGE